MRFLVRLVGEDALGFMFMLGAFIGALCVALIYEIREAS